MLELVVGNNFVDVVASGCDAGIRYDERLEQDMIAIPIGPHSERSAVAASPSCLAQRGVPTHPRDLPQHACLRARFLSGAMPAWEFECDGQHLSVKGAKLLYPSVQRPYPPVYFGGSSEAAHELAAEQVDTYLTWGEPPAEVAKKVADVRARAARHGRSVDFGIRLLVIVRETDDEAWKAAESLISRLDDDTVSRAQAAFSRMDSEGQRRMAALHAGGQRRTRADLEISPNLWAGVGLVRGGAGTALVGSAKTVAARIEEYAALGLNTFVLSGYPHLEEAYRFAELVFPLLPRKVQHQLRGSLPGASLSGPFGEVVANNYLPRAAEAAPLQVSQS